MWREQQAFDAKVRRQTDALVAAMSAYSPYFAAEWERYMENKGRD